MGRFSIEACFSVVFRGLVVQTGSEGERSRNGSVVCLTAGRAISRQCAYSCALGSEREMGGDWTDDCGGRNRLEAYLPVQNWAMSLGVDCSATRYRHRPSQAFGCTVVRCR